MISLLDHPAVTANLFYPRPDFHPPPRGARDTMVEVAAGVALHARIHEATGAIANLVLFHGNGEVVSDYDDLAAEFARAGARLAVVDYRGYGLSEGEPSLRALLADARPAFAGVRAELGPEPVIVMGRSLGSACAAELARAVPEALAGIVFESGFSDVGGFAERRGLPRAVVSQADLDAIGPLAKLAASPVPLLVLHGERDTLIPAAEGRAAYEAAGTREKELVIVPGRGHNDASFHPLYWQAMRAFVARVIER
jgi:hypothetical protein